jgi:hypothetical protein
MIIIEGPDVFYERGSSGMCGDAVKVIENVCDNGVW